MLRDGTINSRLDDWARKAPDRLTLRDLDGELTYADLAEAARQAAGALAGVLHGAGRPIALLAPLDRRFHLGLLGVLRAGHIALVLDPDHPDDRLRRIADHAGAAAVLTTRELEPRARAAFPSDLPLLTIEDAAVSGLIPDGSGPRPEDVAYILYTSGSTGAPKGVAHDHANALNDAAVSHRTCGITEADRGAVYYAGTMGTVRNSLCFLLAGGGLEVLPARTLGADRLVDEIRTRGVTIVQAVPTLLRRITAQALHGPPLPAVRLVRMIGERVHWSDLDLVRRAFGPKVQLQVSIGSTECSSTFAQWLVDDAVRTPSGRLPVGRPIPEVEVALLDDAGAPVADGEPGQVVVASRRLALGYWREPELTAEAFGVRAEDPEVRTFATGDICLRRPDGLLEYVGRMDRMLKIRGHRLEPGEVEAALRECSGLADGVVVVRRTGDGRPIALAAYAEAEPNVRGLLPRHVLAMLSRMLPAYMLPVSVQIGPLPRLANFKPDRQALERLDAERVNDVSARSADPLLDAVATVFEGVVGCSGASGDDNLLSLGGDSLQAVEVILELQARLGVRIPKSVFGQSRTIAELALWIRRHGAPVKAEP